MHVCDESQDTYHVINIKRRYLVSISVLISILLQANLKKLSASL